MDKSDKSTFYIRLSRIRTYIRDLEGPCPNPLDDGPNGQINLYRLLLGGIGFEPMTSRSQSEHSTKLN